MKQKRYTIQELSELTGYSRRTIRYYIQEGLLEPPAGRGRGGYYYDSHWDALSKIRQLQNQGLQLASISRILKSAEMATLEKDVVHKEEMAWEGYVAETTPLGDETLPAKGEFPVERSRQASRLPHPSKPQHPQHPQHPPHPRKIPQPPARQVWIRYHIADGVALHIRRDIDIEQRKKIDQVIRLADAILKTSAKGD